MNTLASSPSSYLRSAAHQPIHWRTWSAEAFAQAEAEDKPILLDIGAVWCHWCHVMDGESYEDPEVAAVVNELFVAIKVDRDEQPDVDTRYQAAVQAISGQGGWPLTAFLTPDGRPYYGTTYIPRDNRWGRPGIVHVLRAMAEVWRTRRDEALDTARQVVNLLARNENFSLPAALTGEIVEGIVNATLARFDPRHGGFGAQPKFPHSSALDLLLHYALKEDDAAARDAALLTLAKMAGGGICDQLAGGFHRYSVDEIWRVPHFEKMLYDNTELLRNYTHAFQSYASEEMATNARAILAWMEATLSDRALGGFYASQDADVGLDDDGDFFTWTSEEARAALDDEAFDFACAHWGLRKVGDMHHNPQKNVLHIARPLEAMVTPAQSLEDLRQLRDRARAQLLSARRLRTEPFIDRTLYTNWNAMAVRASLEAARVLGMNAARSFALLTLDRLLAEAWDGNRALRHVLAYGDGSAPAQHSAGTLDDYAFTVHACIEAWLATGAIRYYNSATQIADAMIALFHDSAQGGFFDAATTAQSLGVLATRRKPLQDTPTPAANPVAASALLRLATLGNRTDYRAIGEETLASFAGLAGQFGLYAGSYAQAVEQLLADPVQVVIVGAGAAADALEAIAHKGFAIHKTVIRLLPAQITAENLPAALAETLLHAPAPAASWALVCKGRTCLPPMASKDELRKALEG